jgi:hypothetical protein
MMAAEGELYVQMWLRPGDEAVELILGDERDLDLIPEGLREYL